MDDETAPQQIRDRYLRFAEVEARRRSPRYAEWARGLAADEQVLALLAGLPPLKQQANLVFAAIRFAGVPLLGWQAIRERVVHAWPDIEQCIRSRSTQTNEPRRLATLLPAFARVTGPLAILEVGASMGLCLQPRRWRYDYRLPSGALRSLGEPTAPTLRCQWRGPGEPPSTLPEVVWSGGLDLNPLSSGDPEDVRWLETLIWPVGEGEVDRERVERLHAAVALSARCGPQVAPGDLLSATLPLIEQAQREGVTTVVFHTAVLAYLTAPDRADFTETMRAAPVTWISNEGQQVLPEVAARLQGRHLESSPHPSDFVIAIDEEPAALCDPHGTWVRPLPIPATQQGSLS